EGEDAGIGMLLNFGDDLHVIADITISEEADNAQVILRVARGKSSADGLHHLGSAGAAAAREKHLCLANILRCGINRLGKEDVRVTGEGDQVEGIATKETIQCEVDYLLRLLNGEPHHRA